ncbi:Acid phosphatase, class B-like [Dillenia turbinata]|uniref:Acid phosphatase, class B-like n=1 Tax=Dillenia turbinata TaxID=194707 RepID=A0AAN8ZNF4_9MAGN
MLVPAMVLFTHVGVDKRPCLKLYEEVLKLGCKIVLLTGRNENQRSITVENLTNVGFQNWDKLILRMEVFDAAEFDKWAQKAMAPPIESNLKLCFQNWEKLILRSVFNLTLLD